jgi:amidase
MSYSLEDLRLMFKALLTTKPWTRDPNVLPIDWQQEEAELQMRKSGLCFGLMMDDGVVMPHPPITRALRIVEAALAAKGHSVRTRIMIHP